jgi:hypothetical protein
MMSMKKEQRLHNDWEYMALFLVQSCVDSHWVTMASENPTIKSKNRGTEMLRRSGKQSMPLVQFEQPDISAEHTRMFPL